MPGVDLAAEKAARLPAGDCSAVLWKEVDGVMAKVERNPRPLLRFLSLQGTPANSALLETPAAMVEAFELSEPLPVLEVSSALIPAGLSTLPQFRGRSDRRCLLRQPQGAAPAAGAWPSSGQPGAQQRRGLSSRVPAR